MFRPMSLLLKVAITAAVTLNLAVSAFSQDDTVPAKVLDATNRAIGKAELVLDTGAVKTNFGYNVKLWLDGGSRLIFIRPQSGSRSSTINCSFREYKVDPKNPKDDSRWNETGSGIATLQMPAEGDVQRITASVTLTAKVVGDNETPVSEKPQKFVIVLD